MRTTFIVGFPGETEEHFQELCDFATEMHFERAGVFTYSFEPGTPATKLPDHLPEEIEAAFREGAMCLAVSCHNAAATMFRLCVDLATRSLLPTVETPGLNAKVRRDLGLRLPWLFQNQLLPTTLHDLSACIKEDGNDGAHAGNLSKADAAALPCDELGRSHRTATH